MNFAALSRELRAIMEGGAGEPISEPSFNDLALRVFRFQCWANRAYGAFVTRRGVDPAGVTSWVEIPFLPTRAFKSMPLVSGDPAEVERIFRTSGTTLGEGSRGEHHVLDLDLYRGSLLGNFSNHVLGGLSPGVSILSLLPSSDLAIDSSLSFMMHEVVRVLGGEGSGFFVGGDGELEAEALWGALQEAGALGEPVLVVGTAFSLLRWVEVADRRNRRIALPEGSRIMETGGYKGRSRKVPRAEFYEGLERVFGVEEGSILGEYGMTELLSQFYEPVLGNRKDPGIRGLVERYYRGPPWVRSLAVDPLTLESVPPGEPGILAHLDLANLGSVAAILTEDLGRMVPGGFQLLGRSPGSELRGCSLAFEDFLSSRNVAP